MPKNKKKYGQRSLSSMQSLYKNKIADINNGVSLRVVKTLPTESWGLHHVIGLPGVPIGHIMEIYGPPGAGKTTMSNYVIGEAQQALEKPGFVVDVESKYMLEYAESCGVDLREINVGYPRDGEEACEMVLDGVTSNAYSSVVLDSVGALVFKAELEGSMYDYNVGLQARKISQFIRKLALLKNNSDTVIILVNQVRAKLGVVFGNPENTPGGWCMEHLASVRLRIGKGSKIENGGEQIGFYMNVVAHKAFGEPYRRAQIPLIYYRGLYIPAELLLTCKTLGIVEGNYNLVGRSKTIKLGRNLMTASKAIMRYRKSLSPKVAKLLEKEAHNRKITITE